MYYRDGNGFSHMGDGWQWLLMGVFWIVLILLAVLAVVVLIRALQPRHSVPGVPVPDALALLDVRLARGEIDVETYDVLRARLVAARSGL
jgi:putative membrane protein